MPEPARPSVLLITGGCGFIGSNFVRHWLTRFPADRVVVYDLLTYAGRPENLAELRGNAALQWEWAHSAEGRP